ncbi:hypothetical protein HPB47_012193 [Ixodes persulcatus]|uniref:Uncharacterized protein n=1 Tax=Ixodes persulcatus TaxID=34615 RepID=A0AC60NUA2_IXOPE|nr:hypothetical protein HPB47_012193 [Ixodes persulcatus]
MNTRFPDLKMCHLPALAMLVDPRYKDACYIYIQKPEKMWALNLLTKEAEDTITHDERDENDDAASSASQCLEDTAGDSVWSAFANLNSNATPQWGPTVADEAAD